MTKSGSHPVFHRCSDGKMRRTYNANYMRRIGWLRLSCPVCDFDKVYVNVMAANRPEAVRDVRKASSSEGARFPVEILDARCQNPIGFRAVSARSSLGFTWSNQGIPENPAAKPSPR